MDADGSKPRPKDTNNTKSFRLTNKSKPLCGCSFAED